MTKKQPVPNDRGACLLDFRPFNINRRDFWAFNFNYQLILNVYRHSHTSVNTSLPASCDPAGIRDAIFQAAIAFALLLEPRSFPFII